MLKPRPLLPRAAGARGKGAEFCLQQNNSLSEMAPVPIPNSGQGVAWTAEAEKLCLVERFGIDNFSGRLILPT
jgi:hypothetical protein